MRPATKHKSPVIPHRVVDILGPTTRCLMDDIQAETHSYCRIRSESRLDEANHVATSVPDTTTSIGTDSCKRMANEVTHAVTGESLNIRKLLQNPETRPFWKVGNYNEYGRLFQGHKEGVKGTYTCFFIPHNMVPKGRILADHIRQIRIASE
jgi:hypothetical protein